MDATGGAIRRLDLGYFVRPAIEVGGAQPRVEPVLGYLVRRDEGTILFDTGIGAADAETEAHYRPRRRELLAALAAVGQDPAGISLVVNCHLHFDHCGGNSLLAGRPILVQAAELAAARGEGYTFPELVDFPGVAYRQLDGEAEIWPGVWIIPTPGHTQGHQSLVVRQPDGSVTSRRSSAQTSSPGALRWRASRLPFPRTGRGWNGSRSSIRAACCSPTTVRCGSRRAADAGSAFRLRREGVNARQRLPRFRGITWRLTDPTRQIVLTGDVVGGIVAACR
jgi:N-acyl homoserine lactone hydrolase